MTGAVVCRRCGATNRVDRDKAGKGMLAVCGRCKTALTDVEDVSDAGFDAQVLGSPLPVLLDVWAAWCMPCRGMAPIVEELATTLLGRLRVAKLDVDQNPATAARLRIEGIPTLILFKEGHEIGRMIGARGKDEILSALAGLY